MTAVKDTETADFEQRAMMSSGRSEMGRPAGGVDFNNESNVGKAAPTILKLMYPAHGSPRK